MNLETLAITEFVIKEGKDITGRSNAACCHFDNKIYIYGGYTMGKTACKDLVGLDLLKKEWK